MAYPFNPGTQEAEADRSCESEASLVYRESSKPARGTWQDPVSINKQINKYKQRTNEMVVLAAKPGRPEFDLQDSLTSIHTPSPSKTREI